MPPKKRKRTDDMVDDNPRRSKRLAPEKVEEKEVKEKKDDKKDNEEEYVDTEGSDEESDNEEGDSDEDNNEDNNEDDDFIDTSDPDEYKEFLDAIFGKKAPKSSKLPVTLEDKFKQKCEIFDLPSTIKDIKSEDVENYEKVKQEMLDKVVSLESIIKLNISNTDRVNLVEQYSLMKNHETPSCLEEYIRLRNKLYKNYQRFCQQSNENTELEKMFKDREAEKKRLSSLNTITDYSVEDKILSLNIHDHYKSFIYDRFQKMNLLGNSSDEKLKMGEWLKNVISLPNNTMNNMLSAPLKPPAKSRKGAKQKIQTNSQILSNIKEQLDQKIHGMQNVKEEILMVINQKLNNPSSTNCTFALVGEPGTGKTKIIRILSEILSLPMEQISMGGVNDVSQLEGHSYTYLGSKPGKIVESIQKMKCNNGIMFFDEIDKIGDSRHGREVTNALIHITDFTQNSTFHDNYIGQIPIDLSKIWFIFSLNDENLVNPILRNRMKMIQVPKYSRKDRVEIARKLMNEIHLDLNIDEKVIKFTDENIEYIIDKIKQEAGVRELKRTIETILRKIKLLIDCGDMKTSFDNDKLDLTKRPIKLKESDLDIFMKGMVNVYDFEKMSYFI